MSFPEAAAAVPAKAASIGTASTFSFQQALVTIALSYQLLFSREGAFTMEVLEFVIVGLLSIVFVVMLVPHQLWRTRLIVGALILGDTALCANVFYMSGFTEPPLYVALVLLIPIAYLAPTLERHFVFSLGLCVAYGIVWYVVKGRAGPITEAELLQFPVLLVMASFYWHVLAMRGRVAGTQGLPAPA